MSTRSFLAAWLTGGGLWLLGLIGLVLVPQPYDQRVAYLDGAAASGNSTYYVHTRTSSLHQDPSGKYTVVVRGIRPVAHD